MQAVDLGREDIHTYLARHQKKELLRFLTCGSVDDGKSTLIGRLLHDTKMIYEDQLAAVKRDSEKVGTTGAGEIDLALLTDGLKAEREEGPPHGVGSPSFPTDPPKFHPRRPPRPRAVPGDQAPRPLEGPAALPPPRPPPRRHDPDTPALVHRIAPGHPPRR